MRPGAFSVFIPSCSHEHEGRHGADPGSDKMVVLLKRVWQASSSLVSSFIWERAP